MTTSLPRQVLDEGDLARLRTMIEEDPSLVTAPMAGLEDHPLGPTPLSYVAMARYDTHRCVWRDLEGTGEMARLLIAAGARVDGDPGDTETPLMTAASYGDAEVAKALIEAGAAIEERAADDAGGVPEGTALLHAAVFGMTDVVDVLVAAGATVSGIAEAAATGDLGGWLTPDTPADARIRALVMAADHQRLDVIDRLVADGTPVDGVDPVFGRHPLRTAAGNGRPDSVERLLAHGADPNLADPDHGLTPLGWCRSNRDANADTSGFDRVEATLEPLTL